jgi:hypothetical protein
MDNIVQIQSPTTGFWAIYDIANHFILNKNVSKKPFDDIKILTPCRCEEGKKDVQK